VSEDDFESMGSKLIDMALERLDISNDISVNVLRGDFGPLLKEKNYMNGMVLLNMTIQFTRLVCPHV